MPKLRFQPRFALPDSPQAKEYDDIVEFINRSKDVDEAALMMKLMAENDFWFFCRFVMTTGGFTCGDVDSDWYGRPWLEHPWLFERCRAIQLDNNNPPILRKWPRGHLKTELLTKNHTLWDNAIHSNEDGTPLRTLILTYKKDTTGEQIFRGIRREIEVNDKLWRLWPNVFHQNTRDYAEFTSERIRLKQCPGIREATVVIASLDKQPVSGHFDRIKYDDAVVRETVTSRDQINKTYAGMQQAVALQADHTLFFAAGTSWRVGDPWDLAESDGMLVVDHQDCFGPMSLPKGKRTIPVLYSEEWYNRTRKQMSSLEFAAHYRGDPAAESDVTFEDSWIGTYDNDPYDEKDNGNVFIIVDPSGESKKKDDADNHAIIICKLGPDGYKYMLDMYRERLTVTEWKDLIFYLAGEPAMQHPDKKQDWWGRGDWRPRGGTFRVFEEVLGASREIAHLKDEMNRRSFRFPIEKIPRDPIPRQLSKEERIRSLMMEMDAGKWLFPKGFGHCPRSDKKKDVLDVFLDKEYRRWTPEGGAEHDDLLDAMAWTSRPGLKRKMPWPIDHYTKKLTEGRHQ
jgi:hypothetical protein